MGIGVRGERTPKGTRAVARRTAPHVAGAGGRCCPCARGWHLGRQREACRTVHSEGGGGGRKDVLERLTTIGVGGGGCQI